MTATVFRLHDLETGRHVAWAVICVEARYASLQMPHVQVLARRYARPERWQSMERELQHDLTPGPLAAPSAISQTLAAERAAFTVVQYVTQAQVPDGAAAAEALDALLRRQPTIGER